ncbi:hypothetical protein [uncultured Bacteroides sp.]|uniref:hypothetical protein n=1 Tax=uncultured Bacteroides sp. TaxID=162156 RepID=UPI002AA61DBD|nr:hypothetical protein [uncultured Bacteroides sp.]
MSENTNILSCYVSITQAYPDADQRTKDLVTEQGRLFRGYIFGEKRLSGALKILSHKDYGKDLILVLFQFYVNPILMVEQSLKEIENYRKNEKFIGMPIIINNKNFFSRSEEERNKFLKNSILQKMDVLAEVVKQKTGSKNRTT